MLRRVGRDHFLRAVSLPMPRAVQHAVAEGERILVRVRRLVCPTRAYRHTFREQVHGAREQEPGALERYRRRTALLNQAC